MIDSRRNKLGAVVLSMALPLFSQTSGFVSSVERAIDTLPEQILAQHLYNQSTETHRSNIVRHLPSLQGNIAAEKQWEIFETPSPNNSRQQISLQAQQVLFNWQSIQLTAQSAHEKRRAELMKINSEQTLLLTMAEVWQTAWLGSEKETRAEQTLARMEKLVSMTEEQIKGGELTITDRQMALRQLYTSQSALKTAQFENQQAQLRFQQMFGTESALSLPQITGSIEKPEPKTVDNHPSIQSSSEQIDMLKRKKSASWGNYIPTLTLYGSWQKSQEKINSPLNYGTDDTRIGIRATFPLIDGGTALFTSLANREALLAEEKNREVVTKKVQQSVQFAYDQYYKLQHQNEILKKVEQSAQDVLTSMEQEFAGGTRTLTDILAAQETVTKASVERISAESELFYSAVYCLYCCGTLSIANLKQLFGE